MKLGGGKTRPVRPCLGLRGMTTSSRVTRLKSSFIYLANAVNDLRGNWDVLAVVIAPVVLLASLCLLPDALNLQHRVVQTFEAAGGQYISFVPAQIPVRPDRPDIPLYPVWFTRTLHLLLIVFMIALKLVVLCALKRMRDKTRLPDPFAEAIAVYRQAIPLAPAFLLVVVLQWLATAIGFSLLVVPGLLVYVWLYFSQYALVFDDRHGWVALLFSRDLMRRRFFKVAIRVVVFLAVWSGYNSWTASVFVIASLLLGPASVITNSIAATVFLMDLLAVAAAYATTAFFMAAGLRMYEDLRAIVAEHAPAHAVAIQATVPLGSAKA